jgi:hypothetical protein
MHPPLSCDRHVTEPLRRAPPLSDPAETSAPLPGDILLQGLRHISERASDPEQKVNNLESDDNSKHFLLLPFFDVVPGCRDIDCPFSVTFNWASTFE